MAMATHRINRVEFELEVGAVELGRHVSDRVSMLHAQKIPSLLDRVCSEIDDSEQVDRIDVLELDLGSIMLSSFDDELLCRLEAALRQALRDRPRAQQRRRDPLAEDSSRADDAHELLDGYAWTGNLPWWADAHQPGVLALPIRDLLVHAPTRWLELLRTHAEHRVGLDRLARVCDAELFELILERGGAGDSLPDLRALDQMLALVGAGSGLSHALLLGALAREGRLEAATVLPAVVRELDADVLAALAELLDAQPNLGTMSLHAAVSTAVIQAARDQPSNDHAHASTGGLTTVEQASDMIELAGRSTPPRPTQSRPTDDLAPTTRARTPKTSQPSPTRSPQPTRAPQPARAPADDLPLQHQRRRALARLDELYVQDAGLVILWPFIERLFTRVELLDAGRRFRDDAAQTQAIALLGYLALADPIPPEHQLAFAKLLCGRSPEQPCPLDVPLERELCEECDRLLAAVIDHAPVLDSMQIPRFRASFLQRTGVLGTRTGSWLLAVERQPYDLVLERFSWSWAHVKFPWMPEALAVEW